MRRAPTWVVASVLGLAACGGSKATSNAGHGGASGASASTGGQNTGATGAGGLGPVAPPICSGDALTGHFVASNGDPSGDGSQAHPWDLATALAPASAIQPGDTVWMRGGVYRGAFVGKLTGSAGAPVVLRSYPGEWAVIDGAGSTDPVLQVYHAWAVYRDFELTNTDPARLTTDRASGIYVEGANISLVNLVVHDVGTGIICNSGDGTVDLAPALEVYGDVLYNNGWQDVDRGHGHQLYLQNHFGSKSIGENLLFHAFGFGVHAYSDTDSNWIQGYELTGNVWFGNGAATQGDSKLYDGCMVGHNGTHPVARVTLRENMGWAPSGERDLRLGWSAPDEDVHLFDNWIVGQTSFDPVWQSVEMTGNTFFGSVTGVDVTAYPGNTVISAAPTAPWVFVRPNKYQAGRANIVVYNWADQDTVEVDVSKVLSAKMPFEVRNAQDMFGAPVLTGVYDGSPLALPMSGLAVAQPIGLDGAIIDSEKTGRAFNVFVLTSGC